MLRFKEIENDGQDFTCWQQLDYVANIYNRAIIYDADYFHAAYNILEVVLNIVDYTKRFFSMKMAKFTKFLIIWISQNLAIPFGL